MSNSQPLGRLRGEQCVSDQRFDRWFAGELDAQAEHALIQHVGACAACSERQRQIEAARSGFELPFISREVTPAVKRRRPARVAALVGSVAALAAAAAAALWVASVRPDDGLRVKGEHRLGFYVLHAGEVRQGAAGEALMPGDSIRFVARSTRSGYVTVLSRDGAGQASVYYPAGERAAPLPAGVERTLDSAVVLDHTLGEERLHALFCREPVLVQPLRSALQAQGEAFRAPRECDMETIRVRKVPAP